MEYQVQTIESVRAEIDALPKGTVVYKDISGTKRPYLQWKENGKTKNKYLRQEEIETVKRQIKKRRELSALLKSMQMEVAETAGPVYGSGLNTNVISGKNLQPFIDDVLQYKRRDCFGQLDAFLKDRSDKKVCAIYGLRRSGKTVMIKQAISDIASYQGCCAYIKLKPSDNLAVLSKDLDSLIARGIKYIFLDEITLLPDFIDGAAMLSDVYAELGIKIVISGTDSLGFLLASGNELYDRCHLVHTTYISFAEHSRLLGIEDIDEYLRYGGTLRAGALSFDKTVDISNASFRDDESTRQYIDTAICYNIQNSLKYFMGGHFRGLEELYNAGTLTNAINRIIEDENHRFAIDVITKAFSSGDFGSAAQLARKIPDSRYRLLDSIDRQSVVSDLKKILDIRDGESVLDYQVQQIKEYLKALDLIDSIAVESLPPSGRAFRTVLVQPGLRFCQAEALVFSLENNAEFQKASRDVQEKIKSIILSDVAGELLEEIVMLSVTRKCRSDSKKRYDACKLQFFDGEIDMLLYDKETNTCRLFEIKHSKEIDKHQYRHLADADKAAAVEDHYGKIAGRYVLYRGKDLLLENGVQYLNVEKFLTELETTAL